MNKETLRMQMLAGVITESQYKERLNENISNSLEELAKELQEQIQNGASISDIIQLLSDANIKV